MGAGCVEPARRGGGGRDRCDPRTGRAVRKGWFSAAPVWHDRARHRTFRRRVGCASAPHHRDAMPGIFSGTSIISISIRSSTAWRPARAIGRAHRSGRRSRAGYIPPVGHVRARTRATSASGRRPETQAEAGTISLRRLGAASSGGVQKRTPTLRLLRWPVEMLDGASLIRYTLAEGRAPGRKRRPRVPCVAALTRQPFGRYALPP